MDFASQFQGVLIRALSPSFSFAVPSLSFSPSFSFLPSFSLLPVLAFLPSFFKLSQVRRATHSEQIVPSNSYRAYFMFMISRKNLHMCKLPLAGSRSPIVKYDHGSHIGFAFPLYKPDTFVCTLNAQVHCIHYLHIPP